MDRRTERDRPQHRGEISPRAKVKRSVVSNLSHPFMCGLELCVRALMCVLWKRVGGGLSFEEVPCSDKPATSLFDGFNRKPVSTVNLPITC